MHSTVIVWSPSTILVIIGVILMVVAAFPRRDDPNQSRFPPINLWYLAWAFVALGAFGPFSIIGH